MIDTALDPLGFAADELIARGALVERDEEEVIAVLPAPVARELDLPETCALGVDAASGRIPCGLGAPLLDRLIADVREHVPVAGVTWLAEPPRLGVAERMADRMVVRNGVATVLGSAHVSTTYVAAVLAWRADADDRYEGLTFAAAHGTSGDEPDAAVAAAFASVVGGGDDRVAELDVRSAPGPAGVIGKRSADAIAPRLAEIGIAVARRRDRERARIDEYFRSLIDEAKRPRRQIGRDAIDARVAALRAEHAAKLRDLEARYTLRVKIEPLALVVVATRVAEIRLQLRRRKHEREIELHVPPGARMPDALACAACSGTTRAPLLCDDALHVLCEDCAPESSGRPRCSVCLRKARR